MQLISNLDIIKLRLKNVYLLIQAFFKLEEYHRILRFLTQNTTNNLFIKDLIQKLSLESTIQDTDI